MSAAPDLVRDDLAKVEQAFRDLAKRACDPQLSMAATKQLKAEAVRLEGQMRRLRKEQGLPFVGRAWVRDVVRGPR